MAQNFDIDFSFHSMSKKGNFLLFFQTFILRLYKK